jgi:hypothetical protein
MTVKAVRGRRRYVVFSVRKGLTKSEMIGKFNAFGDTTYIVQCSSGFAILRCAPKETEDVKERMKKMFPDSEPLLTSGTLRTLRTRIPELGKDSKVR